MHKRVCLIVLACVVFAVSGCDTVKPYWKSTKGFYKTYINVDPTIDIASEDKGTSNPTVRKLADLFTPVDARLEHLLRTLSTRDVPPEDDWLKAFLNVYPWVSGVVVLDESNKVVRGMKVSPKQISWEPLLAFDKRYKTHDMAAAVAPNELGPEILIAKPLWVDGEYKGLLVTYFDPVNLAKFSPDPSQLIMFMPGTAFNAGGNADAAQALAARKDWEKTLKSNVSGEITVGATSYLWQSRYVAQLHLLYAVASAPKPVKGKPEAVKAPASAPDAVQPAPPQTPGQDTGLDTGQMGPDAGQDTAGRPVPLPTPAPTK